MAILAVGALLLSQCGDGEEPADGAGESTTTTADAAAPAAPGATEFVAPPAPDPLPPPATATPAPQPAAPQPAAPAPLPPALSGPPPVTVGTMPDLAIAADGFAHAVFIARFFDGPIEGYWATSSDNGVATAGVSPPDMLIVAPVTNGAASITVTASGPGGTATQTFTARVGAGAPRVERPAAPAPASPPAPAPDEGDDGLFIDDLDLPTEDLPAVSDADGSDASAPQAAGDDGSAEPLPPAPQVTEAPSLSGSIPEQLISVGQTETIDVGPYFVGVVQGWAVESSSPTTVAVTMAVAGEVTIRGLAEGLSTVTVTATNAFGSVAQAIRVPVRAGSGAGGTQGAVPDANAPVFMLDVGQSIRVDIAQYFSAGATAFNVVYDVANPGGRVDVLVRGSEATIRGVQAGKIVITLAATLNGQRVTQLATVDVAAL